MTRILLAVNDSPAGVAAARTAIRFAHECQGQILAVHVVDVASRTDSHPAPRRQDSSAGEQASRALLGYITNLATQSEVEIETTMLPGRPAEVILDRAAVWGADIIVLGRSGVRHVGQPFVGSQVLHVIEFADVPVLVVPAA